MPLTGSGQITLGNVATEKGASSSNISLTLESTSGINTNSPSYPDGAAPHQLSEFYNYDHNASGGGSWPPPYLVPEAQTFLEVIDNMVENSITIAINQLVMDMMGIGNYGSAPWDSLFCIYPFVGGTATAHRFNLKDPNQYAIGWNGGVTHDANGVTGNGSNGYGLTYFLADDINPKESVFIGSYCGNNTAQNGYDMGATVGSNVLGHISRYGGNQVYFRPFNAGANQTTSTDSSGWNWTMRNSDPANIVGGKNDQYTKYTRISVVTSAISEYVNILALRTSGGGNTAYSNKNLRMAVIGRGFDEPTAVDLYYMIQDFQNTLGRGV